MKMKLYGLDIETYDPHLVKKGASWVYGEGHILCTSVYSKKMSNAQVFKSNGGKAVKQILLNPDITLVGTNIVYDLGWLCYEHGLKANEVKCGLIDIAIAEAFIDEYQQFSLDALAWKYLKERKKAEKLEKIALNQGLKGDFRRHLKELWDLGFTKEIAEYVSSDADQPVRIWEKQKEVLNELAATDYAELEASLEKKDVRKSSITLQQKKDALEFAKRYNIITALDVNFKLIKIVLDMKQRGVRVDMAKRKQNYELLKGIQDRLQSEFEGKYGKVNFNSTKQLAALFDRERVPYKCKIRVKSYINKPVFAGSEIWQQKQILKETFKGIRVQKGQIVLFVPKQYAGRTNDDIIQMGYVTTCNPNIDKKAIDAIKNKYEVGKSIKELKQVTSIIDKFLGPNFDRFIVKHGEDNYRIHADFNIVGARATGRFSSAKPNLQQIPSKTVLFAKTENEIKLYKLCRETIIPDEGMLMGKCDYAGQESRLMAHFAVGTGANEIRRKYNENPELDLHDYVGQISGLQDKYGIDVGRKYAKNCAFGLGYGMQLTTMMETFEWDREDAMRITELYHEAVPFVKSTMDKVSDVIVKRGYIKTLAGRHCHLRKFNGKVDNRSAYKGFNKLIQGSAADMIKKAVVMLDEQGVLDVFPLYLLVHDEIDFGVPNVYKLIEIKIIMENTYPMTVPFIVDPEVGKNWGHVLGRKTKVKKKDGTVVDKVLLMERFLEKVERSMKRV
jgi:DNA polymerase I-like protein with 3'-5' exonuclease and polymerase domains